MNIEKFTEQFGHLKDVDKIFVDDLCDHENHQKENKQIGRGAAKRNILKNGGGKFICRACDMKYNNPVKKIGMGSRQSNEEINVICPDCQKTRVMKKSCFYGELKEPFPKTYGNLGAKIF